MVIVATLLLLKSQQVEGKQVHHLAKLFQTVGAYLCLMVDECIHQMASLEEITYHKRSHHVVVHGIVAALAQ